MELNELVRSLSFAKENIHQLQQDYRKLNDEFSLLLGYLKLEVVPQRKTIRKVKDGSS